MKWVFSCQLLLLLLLFLFNHGCSRNIIKKLPGFPDQLPFNLESGYISVRESELFYLFVESQGDPKNDPVLLFLSGGPLCSGFYAFFYQVGPVFFNTGINDGVPSLSLYPHSWTKNASIIFTDAPVGTGFSYSKSEELTISDSKAASQIHMFIRKWFQEHSEFNSNLFYIVGDSYGGMYGPMVATYILNDNEMRMEPHIKLMGFVGGSPYTDDFLHRNNMVTFSHRMGFISDELFQSAKDNCNGIYVDVDISNTLCFQHLVPVKKCITDLNLENVVKPNCGFVYCDGNFISDGKQSPKSLIWNFSLSSRSHHHNLSLPTFTCQDFCSKKKLLHQLAYEWANNKRVQEALHIRKGAVEEWHLINFAIQCNTYDYNVKSVVDYHRNLTKTGLRVLIYGGDHELIVPHLSTEIWIKNLNLLIDSDWRPWVVDDQIAGYTMTYANSGYHLTYATVKGGSHSPTEGNGRECYEMFLRWIQSYPL